MAFRLLSLVAALAASLCAVNAQSCPAITAPAPCGQPDDTQAQCELKGCCWDSGRFSATPCFYSGGNAVPITKVHVVQACHFDAGFADSLVGIVNRWFTLHFPQAYKLGLELAALGGPWGLKFMAQSWLVYLYTHCPAASGLQCPSPAALVNFTAAVKAGYITWHAFPHNAELELLDQSLFSFGVDMTHALDDAFGVRRKTVLSQRDVPGMTRAVLPTLAAAGVRGVSVGVNGASAAPDVPRAFVWRDPVSGTALPAMWHPKGYGGNGAYDAVVVPGLASALVMDWRGDNAGPPQSVDEVQGDWKGIAAEFPGATVVASTFDDWMDELETVAAALPVIEAEVGDTWLHGTPSDPQKLAWFRRGQAVRTACIAEGACDPADPVFRNFSSLFIKNAEHTWGKDVKTFLHDTDNWSNAQLAAQLAANASNFIDIQASWDEQRTWGFEYPLQALGGHPLAAQLTQAWAAVYPGPAPSPAGDGWAPFAPGAVWSNSRWSIAFDAATGGISLLADAATGQTWANASAADAAAAPARSNPGVLAWLEYQTYDQDTYTAFMANYTWESPPPDWFSKDFGKPNVSEAGAALQFLPQRLVGLWTRAGPAPGSAAFLVQTAILDAANGTTPHSLYGAPAALYTTVTLDAAAAVNVTVAAYGKTPTRLPESLFLRFNPLPAWGGGGAPAAAAQFFVEKLGARVDPYDAALKGSQKHHGTTGGAQFARARPGGGGANATLAVSSLDAPVVCVGAPFGLPTPIVLRPDPAEGAAFMLYGNTWGTNYVMWSAWRAGDENMQWAFSLTSA